MKYDSLIIPELDHPSLLDRMESSLLPMINIVFLLLVFFMLAGVLMQDQLPDLPRSEVREAERLSGADLIVHSDGALSWAGQAIERDQLNALLPDYNPEERLVVAASGEVTMTQLETLLQRLGQAGHPDIILLSDPVAP
ncbi:ExbD/TolR family protein [Marinimicrobium alkaliphilum]|uniref:ExbD/TolR family protein n=1 Tax=Marinimicrobium alkaliphilum TaxID=2202654 RepID=UPI000DB97341|nr:biopolymer transporter ExbD [Marinimicrobium alkaliphilum]